MPAAPPTARSTTHRTIPAGPQLRTGQCQQDAPDRHKRPSLRTGIPSLHDRAGDKPRAHTTAQTIQKTSQEKEEKGKEEK